MTEVKRPVRLPTEDEKAKLEKQLREHVAAMVSCSVRVASRCKLKAVCLPFQKPSNLGKRKRKTKRRTLQDHVRLLLYKIARF
jgi:hypothetical protein